MALRGNFSGPECSTNRVKSEKAQQVFQSALEKNFLLVGCGFLCEWRHKWRTFRPPWPTLPCPGRKPLGGSISMKFLLETRLQSESFDTLDDLLGFGFKSCDVS